MGTTACPAARTAPTRSAPGSLTTGVPASETRATSRPSASMARIASSRPGVEWAWKLMSLGAAPRWVSRPRVRLVSSAATTGTLRRTSAARGVRSPRFPSGVATTKRVPAGMAGWGAIRPDGAEPAMLARSAPPDPGSRQVLLNPRNQRRLGHGTHDRVHMPAIAEEEDARDRADVEPHGGLLVRVDVELGDAKPAAVLGRELLEHRGDRLAGTAPGRPEVHEDQAG